MSNSSKSKHYDDKYFNWYSSMGEFGGWANLTKFSPYVSADTDVLDFGCGGGYLLKNLACRKRIGLEINPMAADVAKVNGIEVYQSIKDLPDDCCDLMISNSVLEHTHDPLRELQDLMSKLRRGGKIVFIVPCESIRYGYSPGDINRHLYSWSPMCIGNLFDEAGYEVIESKPYIHHWPPFYRTIARFGGRTIFEIACRVYGRIERSWSQVRVVAQKPENDNSQA